MTRSQLERVDFWMGDIYSDDFDYNDVTVVYNSFEEDEDEVGFYRKRFPKRLKVLKKDLPLVGFAPSRVTREGRVWLFRTDFPAARVRKKSGWACMALGRASATIDDVYNYYRAALSKRGITRKDTEMALNHLERMVIQRFS